MTKNNSASKKNSIILIGHDGRTQRLSEKDTLEKLELLYKRNLYQMAITLAQGAQVLQTFLDGYCSTVQGLLDWFEVDLGFTELLFIQIDLCVM